MVKLLPKTEEKSERSNPKKWMLASMISKFSLVSAMLLLWKWQAHGRIAQGRATIRKFVALSFRDKCWGEKRAVCIAFQTSILFYSLENGSELHGANGKAEERIGWVLPPPTHHLIHRSAEDALCPTPFQVPGWLQYLPPFVTLQLLMKWISFSSWKWSSCEGAVHWETSRFFRRK